jgi:hypothetical protein
VSTTMTAHQFRQPALVVAFLAAVGLSFVAGERVGVRMAPATNRTPALACAETSPDCNTGYR